MIEKCKGKKRLMAMWLVIGVIGVVGIGGLVKAETEKSKIAELTEFAKAVGGDAGVVSQALNYLGGLGDAMLGSSGSRFPHGISADNTSPSEGEVRGTTFTSTGLATFDQLTINNTTTPSKQSYFPIDLAMDLTGTSTAKGATQNVITYYTNTGSDKIFTWTGYDITTQLGLIEASIQCGTSTWVGGVAGSSLEATSTAGIMASTTVAATWDTGDTWVIRDVNSYPGTSFRSGWGSGTATASSTAFLLKNAEVFFCTWTPYGATSSASFLSSGGFTGVGRVYGQIWARTK